MQDDADDVLADVMHVTFHRCHDDASLWLRARRFLRFHEWHQVSDGFFHYTGAFYYLWKKHLARAEQVAHHTHSGHKRTLDNIERTFGFFSCLFRIDLDVINDAFYQRVLQTLFHSLRAPCFIFDRRFAFGFYPFRKFDQLFRRIREPV